MSVLRSLLVCGFVVAIYAAPPGPAQQLLDGYCSGCHNANTLTGGIALDRLDVANPIRDWEKWERVIRKLRTGTMPPPGAPRPDANAYNAAANWLETSIDRAADPPNPGRTNTVHRLNRTEYR